MEVSGEPMLGIKIDAILNRRLFLKCVLRILAIELILMRIELMQIN